MNERLTDADLRELRDRFPTHLGEPKISALVQMAVSEICACHAAELVHDQNYCLDCEGPLVRCDCQPNCPGGMCARRCYEVEALRYARAECARMRPVYEAAIRRHSAACDGESGICVETDDHGPSCPVSVAEEALFRAVRQSTADPDPPPPAAEFDHEAFLDRWESAKRAGVPIERCKRCGFEAFPFADATIEEHDKACSATRSAK